VCEGDQETESVSIIGYGVWTGIALVHQSLHEIGLKQFRKGGLRFHHATSFGCSLKVASFNSSGTAERYQYVSLT
jgi:hypothetical protein